jgi:hypothetical protein
MIASNISEVLEIINTIISDAKADNSRHGYSVRTVSRRDRIDTKTQSVTLDRD